MLQRKIRLRPIIRGMNFTPNFLHEFQRSVANIDPNQVEEFVDCLASARSRNGRVFVAGVGGSAANASHMVNDLRKLAGIEAYSVSENTAELTARVNDEGWQGAYKEWLKASNLVEKDLLCVLSVGGGSQERQISMNLIEAIQYAISIGANVNGIIGKKEGFLGSLGLPGVVLTSSSEPKFVTPISETLQQAVWHLAVTHPKLKKNDTTW